MKRRNKYIVSALFIIVIAALGIMYMSAKNTSFKKIVLDRINLQEISSIEIISSTDSSAGNEVRKTITNSSEIEKIMNSFSHIKLRKSRLSNITFENSYWITVKSNGNRAFGLTLYDENYLEVYDYNSAIEKHKAAAYKITNDFDLMNIQKMFE